MKQKIISKSTQRSYFKLNSNHKEFLKYCVMSLIHVCPKKVIQGEEIFFNMNRGYCDTNSKTLKTTNAKIKNLENYRSKIIAFI